jgi:twitching motility protein PilT
LTRIDRLLDGLAKIGGEAIVLTVGRPMSFLAGGALRPASKVPLRVEDITALLVEMTSPEAQALIGRDGEADFVYRSASGANATIHAERRLGNFFIRVRLAAAGSPAASTSQGVAPSGESSLAELEPIPEEASPPVTPILPAPPIVAPQDPREMVLETLAGEEIELNVSKAHPLARRGISPTPISPARPVRPSLTPSAPRQNGPVDLGGLLALIARQRGSDLHLSPDSPPRLRVNGELSVLERAPLSGEETKRLLDEALTPAQRSRFAAEWSLDFSLDFPGVGRFRASACEQRKGVAMVFRAIPPRIPTFTELGLPPAVEALAEFPNGLVLVTGPAGCGKSTTQAAIVDRINERAAEHIITVEDPIEFVQPEKKCLINQREIGTHALSFAEALRSALREDPDVILIGELRDLETIQLAITAAETGHLVIGTLHTIDAARTVDRLIDVFPGRQKLQIRSMLSESLRGVISQRLVRTLDGTGRLAAFEILVADRSVANLIREGKTFQIPNAIRLGKTRGMCALDDTLIELVRKGRISPAEAVRHCVNPDEVRKATVADRRPGAQMLGRLGPSPGPSKA